MDLCFFLTEARFVGLAYYLREFVYQLSEKFVGNVYL